MDPSSRLSIYLLLENCVEFIFATALWQNSYSVEIILSIQVQIWCSGFLIHCSSDGDVQKRGQILYMRNTILLKALSLIPPLKLVDPLVTRFSDYLHQSREEAIFVWRNDEVLVVMNEVCHCVWSV